MVIAGYRWIYNGAMSVYEEVAVRTAVGIDRVGYEVEGSALAVVGYMMFAVWSLVCGIMRVCVHACARVSCVYCVV